MFFVCVCVCVNILTKKTDDCGFQSMDTWEWSSNSRHQQKAWTWPSTGLKVHRTKEKFQHGRSANVSGIVKQQQKKMWS